jgi:biopolymer transport protein ExbD
MSQKVRPSPKLISGIEVSGFAAVMLFLVCVFMVPAGMHMRALPARVNVDLPKVAFPNLVPHARREDAIFVSINRSGDVFFGRDLVRRPDILHERIMNAVKTGSESVVYVNADARLKYKNVKTVIDEVSLSGVPKLVFLVDEAPKH